MSNYEPLLGGSYISLPEKLNNSMKGLINLKNKDHKCFMWCHVRLINPQNRNAERIKINCCWFKLSRHCVSGRY